MRRKILFSFLLLIFALCVPMLFASPAEAQPSALFEATPSPTEKAEDTGEPEIKRVAAQNDEELRFVALIDGELYDCSMADFLPGVLSAEMPASFEAEALKAQAVAARTYIISRIESESPNHPEADICNDASCCQAFIMTTELQSRWGANFTAYWKKMCAAVEATDGQYMTYEGAPILAAFHSSSAGKTENASNLWSYRPYLVSVESPESPEDVPDYVTTVEVSVDDFRSTVLGAYPAADLGGEPSGWLGEISKNSGGRVEYITVGGTQAEGGEVRTLFALRSAAFDLKYTGEYFLFTVTGYGHGIGMSQYGANVMAKGGSGYQEILEHYYSGVTIENAK